MRLDGATGRRHHNPRREIDSIDINAIKAYVQSAAPENDMASITIRNLDESIKQRLRIRAAEHGRSMEEEARDILRLAMAQSAPPRDLAAAIRARIAPLGGVDLDLPKRDAMRDPPPFVRTRG